MYPTLVNFTQRKKNVLCEWCISPFMRWYNSLIYSLGKRKLYCTCLKTTEHEMILSYVKPFNDKMRNFSALLIDDMKRRKNIDLFCSYKNNQQDTTTKVFLVKFPKFLRTSFLTEHLQWLLLTYDKSFLVLVILHFDEKQKMIQ